MGFYTKYLLPKTVHFFCSTKPIRKQREKVVSLAAGRVLKPDGQLIFCEHGAAPDVAVRRWQNRLNPIWKRFGGGCNLNLPIPSLLEQSGFKIRGMDTMYLPGWKPATFNYWGTAGSA